MIPNAKDAQTIVNGKDSAYTGSLPHVGAALHGWMQLMVFGLICKQNIDGYTQEIKSKVTTHALRQPLTPQQLSLKPQGQRDWKWEQLHALPDLQMNPDDQVTYLGQTYRVMEKKEYPEYGYIEYHVGQDFSYLNEVPEYDD